MDEFFEEPEQEQVPNTFYLLTVGEAVVWSSPDGSGNDFTGELVDIQDALPFRDWAAVAGLGENQAAYEKAVDANGEETGYLAGLSIFLDGQDITVDDFLTMDKTGYWVLFRGGPAPALLLEPKHDAIALGERWVRESGALASINSELDFKDYVGVVSPVSEQAYGKWMHSLPNVAANKFIYVFAERQKAFEGVDILEGVVGRSKGLYLYGAEKATGPSGLAVYSTDVPLFVICGIMWEDGEF